MKVTHKRLFFALWPDDPLRHALLHWQTHNLSADLRWQHRADLHMTLHFLGAVATERVSTLCALGEHIQAAHFTLMLDQIGYWPRPQVLWAGPEVVPDGLTRLHARLGEDLAELGYASEQRAYLPHVTLARKVRGTPDPLPLPAMTWKVREFALVESRPGDAPHYHPLARWPLA